VGERAECHQAEITRMTALGAVGACRAPRNAAGRPFHEPARGMATTPRGDEFSPSLLPTPTGSAR
jgi:hypothetical protein